MYLNVSNIGRDELHHLYCSDPQLYREVAAPHRAHRLPNGHGSTRLDAEPPLRADTKVEGSCPAREIALPPTLQID